MVSGIGCRSRRTRQHVAAITLLTPPSGRDRGATEVESSVDRPAMRAFPII